MRCTGVKCLGRPDAPYVCHTQIVADIKELKVFCKNCMSIYNLQASPGLSESVDKNLNF